MRAWERIDLELIQYRASQAREGLNPISGMSSDERTSAFRASSFDVPALMSALAAVITDLDEARAERDALAHVLSLVRDSVVETDDGFFGTDDETLVAALDSAPAASMARHDAEVKAQALDEFADTNELWIGSLVERTLRADAAAIRAEANG